MANILILYYSKHGSTLRLAEEAGYGVESSGHDEAIIRTVPEISASNDESPIRVPSKGTPYATLSDFNSCDGLIMGSPAYFGNMCSQLKYFLDQTSSSWLAGKMIGKPAAVFTSSSSLHGGQESVLLSMMQPLLHHGMIISGLPYSLSELHHTHTGATPYGGSHVARDNNIALSQDEISSMRYLGKRIAKLANHLKGLNC